MQTQILYFDFSGAKRVRKTKQYTEVIPETPDFHEYSQYSDYTDYPETEIYPAADEDEKAEKVIVTLNLYLFLIICVLIVVILCLCYGKYCKARHSRPYERDRSV